mmetsp:Transcript_11441/g.21449  ORF Transcript_11441/g.21449 Transcript_11441/m.21449 type:complete len:155 (-) Transcript_11441:85-549(-)
MGAVESCKAVNEGSTAHQDLGMWCDASEDKSFERIRQQIKASASKEPLQAPPVDEESKTPGRRQISTYLLDEEVPHAPDLEDVIHTKPDFEDKGIDCFKQLIQSPDDMGRPQSRAELEAQFRMFEEKRDELRNNKRPGALVTTAGVKSEKEIGY